MTVRLDAKRASGNPPPIDFARQIMSGFTPKYSLAPPHASFAPVFTSSKISSAPFLVAEIAQALQETGLRHAQTDIHQNRLENDRRDLAGIFFEAPLDAAEIVEAGDDDVGQRCLRDAAATGNGIRRVGIAVFFGFGLHADRARCRAVRDTTPSNLMILSRLVAARAMRHACIVTSVPLEPKRTISTG